LSVYIIMSFDFPFVRLLGVRYFVITLIYVILSIMWQYTSIHMITLKWR